MLRGIRGATTVEKNDTQEIYDAVVELLTRLNEVNELDPENIGAVIFSSTPDLTAAFPAAAARKMGWSEVPLFGTQEIDQPEGVPNCIRVLILLNTEKKQKEIQHVYLKEAKRLRRDLPQA